MLRHETIGMVAENYTGRRRIQRKLYSMQGGRQTQWDTTDSDQIDTCKTMVTRISRLQGAHWRQILTTHKDKQLFTVAEGFNGEIHSIRKTRRKTGGNIRGIETRRIHQRGKL